MYKKEPIKILKFTQPSQKNLIESKHRICKSRIVTDFFKPRRKMNNYPFQFHGVFMIRNYVYFYVVFPMNFAVCNFDCL